MKILFLTPQMQERGGLQRVITLVISHLAQKHIVVLGIVAQNGDISFKIDPNIQVKVFKDCLTEKYNWCVTRKLIHMGVQFPSGIIKNSFFSQHQIESLESHINESNYDLIIAVGSTLPLLLALVDRRHLSNKNIKFFAWHHNSYEAYYHEKGRYAFGCERLAKQILPELNKIITLTKHDADVLHEKFGVNSIYIYNPLSFKTAVKTNLNTKTLLFVGRIDIKQKGIDLLLEIASIIFSDVRAREWKLVIVGDGADRRWVEKEIYTLKLEDHVYCVGDQKDVIPYYLNADILLSTSRWEGFGIVLTEAFECGLPVISFMNNGSAEIINNGGNGYLIPRYDVQSFAERTLQLMCDDLKRNRFSKYAQMRAKDFSIDKIMENWEMVLEL